MKHFLDIGAHVGNTFDRFLCKTDEFDGATIWCFEPSPRHLVGLMDTAERYSGRFDIRVCPFGLWNDDALFHLWQKDDSQGDSFLEVLNDTENVHEHYKLIVPVRAISDFIWHQIPRDETVVIKLDAEGAEYVILEDLKELVQAKQISRIMVEWHHCRGSERQAQIEADYKALGLPLEQWMF
jgi:FkbM family methyltransferase